MFQLSSNADSASGNIQKRPNIVLQIDGIEQLFGSAEILNIIRIGDPGLEIGGGWVIGGSRPVDGQVGAVSFENTTSTIKQQLDIDKGRGQGISSLQVGLIDINGLITEIISPGVIVDDIFGRKASIFVSPNSEITNFPEDYIRIFRGIIDDVQAGPNLITINIAHPDQKKRQQIFIKGESTLSGAITNSQTTIPLTATSKFLQKVLGPDATYDSSFGSYVKIDDEIIKYDAISGLNLTGCTRGQLGTTASAHASGAASDSIYQLQGNAIDLALKIMASGSGYFVEDAPLTNFNRLGDGTLLANSIFFRKVNVAEVYGITVGDYITTSGDPNGANNVTLKQIAEVSTDGLDSYIVVSGVSFVESLSSNALISFRSQYDTLPDGLSMGHDEIDVAQHLKVKQTFLSSFDYDFRFTDTIENGKEFLEQEIYKPAGAYSIPRAAKSSVAYFIGPIATSNIKILSKENIINPSMLKISRSINKNFANTIVYKFDKHIITEKFVTGEVYRSATSINRIPVGTKALIIESSGIRSILNGANITQAAASRKLNRFRFGAESIPGVQVTFGAGFNIELADIVILDSTDLNVANTVDGDRAKPPRMYEVNNISKDFKTGKITVDLIDTNFDGSKRYGLISPSSQVRSGASTSQFTIEAGWSSIYGAAEYKKWDKYTRPAIKVRSPDGTTRFGQTYLDSNAGNLITVDPPLAFTPQAGDIMELADYDFPQTAEILLVYTFISDSPFGDGGQQYAML